MGRHLSTRNICVTLGIVFQPRVSVSSSVQLGASEVEEQGLLAPATFQALHPELW